MGHGQGQSSKSHGEPPGELRWEVMAVKASCDHQLCACARVRVDLCDAAVCGAPVCGRACMSTRIPSRTLYMCVDVCAHITCMVRVHGCLREGMSMLAFGHTHANASRCVWCACVCVCV